MTTLPFHEVCCIYDQFLEKPQVTHLIRFITIITSNTDLNDKLYAFQSSSINRVEYCELWWLLLYHFSRSYTCIFLFLNSGCRETCLWNQIKPNVSNKIFVPKALRDIKYVQFPYSSKSRWETIWLWRRESLDRFATELSRCQIVLVIKWDIWGVAIYGVGAR